MPDELTFIIIQDKKSWKKNAELSCNVSKMPDTGVTSEWKDLCFISQDLK